MKENPKSNQENETTGATRRTFLDRMVGVLTVPIMEELDKAWEQDMRAEAQPGSVPKAEP